MRKLKQLYSNNARLIYTTGLHAILAWLTLVIGYNLYKEYVPLSRVVRDSIKGTFPWGILIFVLLYLFYALLQKSRKSSHLTTGQYSVAIAVYTLLMNLLFLNNLDALIAINLSVPFMVATMTVLISLKKLSTLGDDMRIKHTKALATFNSIRNAIQATNDFHKKNSQSAMFIARIRLNIITAIILIKLNIISAIAWVRLIIIDVIIRTGRIASFIFVTADKAYNGISAIKDSFNRLSLSTRFFTIFLILLVVSALLLVSFGERVVKELSSIAYLFLALGVGAGILQLIRGVDKDAA